ncbi:MAG TPA: DUF1924 domain-containing protein [Gammaproteobacteria bacterium]|nr:DUF1924 domain-containing protein [Gammaproteobacteria bacterium]
MKLFIFTILTAFSFATHAAVIDDVLATYKAAGVDQFSAEDGKILWNKDFPDPKKPGKVRNCHTCHGKDLTKKGKHVRTGKVIDPLAPSVNKERFTDPKFIAKWFKRNCKWVIGRQCTAQEKGNVLTYLRNK